jgi:hypothetical protein
MAIKAAIISTALTASVIWFAITIAAYYFGYRMEEDYGDCYRVGRGTSFGDPSLCPGEQLKPLCCAIQPCVDDLALHATARKAMSNAPVEDVHDCRGHGCARCRFWLGVSQRVARENLG